MNTLIPLCILMFVLPIVSFSSSQPRDLSQVPDWAREAVWYQIFPERFRNGDPANDPGTSDLQFSWPYEVPSDWKISRWTGDWYALQPWEVASGRGFYYCAQQRRYGGDLQGVLDKLDYLQDLGISAIYFNPLFESPSLHKYDATMYHHIDNNFGPDPSGDERLWAAENPADPGTWRWSAADKLFLQVVREAHRRGIRVIIDGVFNHGGLKFWALEDVRKNGERSAYKDWFTITRWDDPTTPENEFSYAGWAGLPNHPEFRETDSGLVKGPREHFHAIVRRWMDPDGDGDPQDGIDGWRLDVAEMVAIPFWRAFRQWVREINPDAYLVGEVWWQDWKAGTMFNAEPWLRGDVFDAVMNYRLAEQVDHFFRDVQHRIPPTVFAARLQALLADYRPDADAVLMNLMGSHDTDRLASQIVNPDTRYDGNVNLHDNPAYKVRKPNAGEITIQKLVVTFLMTWVGAPGVYYGDEAGMWGADDPDERKPMLWEDMTFDDEATHPLGQPRSRDHNVFNRDLFDHYRTMIRLRRATPSLTHGAVTILVADDSTGVFSFLRSTAGNASVVVINNADVSGSVRIRLPAGTPGRWARRIGKGSTTAEDGMLRVSLAAKTGEVLTSVP